MAKVMIPYGRQDIDEHDIETVIQVLRSDFLTQGPEVPNFEKKLSILTGSKYVTAVNSATSGLHLACAALGLKTGDILWTSPNSFAASANCARYCGADVDFVDIDLETGLLSVERLEEKLLKSEKLGKLPHTLVAVHFAGQSCDMKRIRALREKYGFNIVEDAAHAIGATYDGSDVGSCKYSDITVFSFHPVKLITSGEGGATLTNNPDLGHKLKLLRSHGITRDINIFEETNQGPWYYEQVALGWNYRMTDIQAALGNSQLNRLPHFISRRELIYQKYLKNIDMSKWQINQVHTDRTSAHHLCCIRTTSNKNKVFSYFRSNGIGVNVHYIPIHLHPYYQKLGFSLGNFPVAEQFYEQSISIPIFPRMKDEEIDYVIQTVNDFKP